MFMINIDVTTP